MFSLSYDEQQDVYVCPQGKIMKRTTLHRSVSGQYWLYLADKQVCQSVNCERNA